MSEVQAMRPTPAEGTTPAEGPGPATAIRVQGVSKRYGDRQAVDDVSLEIRRGEFFGLLGPNGAGKSTLVEIMEGLRRADTGTVALFGESPWPRNTALLPRVGVQTQTSAFFVRQTAHEHLRTVAALYGAPRTAVDATLESVGLTEQSGVQVEDLSGGQRQRLAIASALVHGPELIFLDEPTAALDPQARRALWEVLRALKAEGRTIVHTTHHLDEAEALCDRIAILVDGRIAVTDSPHNLVSAFQAPTRLMLPLGRLDEREAADIPGVDRVTVQGGSLVLETRTPGPVLSAVDKLAGLDGVQTRTAGLEDVYLDLTARLTGSPQSPRRNADTTEHQP
ncbi:ABC transporter ATP-binding protein [Streptomyces nitrosporeus]|uniref:ABC-type xenobiotic transporter n=1 Tax=Streptomyces nitrosporeus TaxID=28894 RepID=A0A5J6F5P8_9ACTN|nr:ABC transporter ATP-binding protein [Streptomyces nitrosporeus]QEU71649.1 ABC transporter ATP-binding protein [Streptomyces nitrosporeus]GGY95440.1 ABC transporter [Streptomyces nitrosporeus]